MPFAFDAPSQPVVAARDALRLFRQGRAFAQASLASNDPLQKTIDRIEVEDASYRLRFPCQGIFSPPQPYRAGRFRVYEFPEVLAGEGATIRDAFADWKHKVDTEVQRLLLLRPFEMTATDSEMFRQLDRVIDLAAYRESVPLLVRAFGVIWKERGAQKLIRWENGQTTQIDRQQYPAEMAGYRVGQHFEATYAQSRRTGRLEKVLFCLPSPPLRSVSLEETQNWEAEAKEAMDDMPPGELPWS